MCRRWRGAQKPGKYRKMFSAPNATEASSIIIGTSLLGSSSASTTPGPLKPLGFVYQTEKLMKLERKQQKRAITPYHGSCASLGGRWDNQRAVKKAALTCFTCPVGLCRALTLLDWVGLVSPFSFLFKGVRAVNITY